MTKKAEEVIKILEHPLMDINKPCVFDIYDNGDFCYSLQANDLENYFFIRVCPLNMEVKLEAEENIGYLIGIASSYFDVNLLNYSDMIIETIYKYEPEQINLSLN